LAELHFGVLRAAGTPRQPARLRRLAAIEHEFEPIPVDTRVARAFGECASAVQQTGRNPRPRVFDLVIAATAMVERATLYTLNPDDFPGLDDLVNVIAATGDRSGGTR
jgi:predicted nucleic acid-binding protein